MREYFTAIKFKPLNDRINKYLNNSLIIFAFVLPISRTGISVFIFVIVLAWIFEGDWERKWKVLKKDSFFLSICAYAGFVLLSLLWTDNYYKAADAMKNYGHLLLVPVMLTSLSARFYIPVARSFAIGMLLLLILCFFNFTGILNMQKASPKSPVLFMHRLDFSMFLAWTVIWGIYFLSTLLRKKRGHIDFYLWVILVTVSFLWMFVQDGRAGQLALFVTAPFLFALLACKKHKLLLVTLLVFFLGFFHLQFQYNKTFRTRVLDIRYDIANVQVEKIYESSVGYRILAWKISLGLIKDRPLAGYGIGDSMDAFKNIVDHWDETSIRLPPMDVITRHHVHNQYLQILLETGILGLLLFFSVFWFFYKGSYDKKASILLIILFFSGFIAEPFMRNQFSSALIALFMGWVYSGHKISNETASLQPAISS